MSKAKKSLHSSEDASSSSGSSSSLSSDEEVDAKDLKPIREYLSDRRELARQLFKSVKAEKIQMMLPQVLKKMDLAQLESCCANELSGMSKSRILCILNGKAMLESSDTSETDDSGPSLEIISDTEEWFTDEDMYKQEEGSKLGKGKVKKDKMRQKGKCQINKKSETKVNIKKVPDTEQKNVQIKKEEDPIKAKEKEGDSLLDLLELEMRARAIRALIRKEEDVIPNTSNSSKDNDTAKEKAAAKAKQDEMKEKENCRRQLERIISAQQSGTAEDEDVVLVVQPTPTIELLSSDSEGEPHSGVRVNKKLENERIINDKDNYNQNTTRDLSGTNSVDNSKEEEKTTTATAAEKNVNSTHKSDTVKRAHASNVSHKDTHKRRKTKKKSHSRDQSKNVASQIDTRSNDNESKKSTKYGQQEPEAIEPGEKEQQNSVKSKTAHDDSSPKKQDSTEPCATTKATLDEEKSIDLDEIIDLDDYCDDMDDMENSENDKRAEKQAAESKQNKPQTDVNTPQKTNGAETWASRYYQTDDVQNVIKESKIQSEIRKRLRERQRLSKLSTSPNKNSPSSSPVVDASGNKIEEKNTLGSVDEYLALKHTAGTSLSAANTNNSAPIKDTAVASINLGANNSVGNDRTSGMQSKTQEIKDKGTVLSNNTDSAALICAQTENVNSTNNVTNPG